MLQATNGPIQLAERIESIDVIRGFSLLGILLMNVQGFSMPALTYINPTIFSEFSGINYAVWLFEHVFVNQKMMNIFSLLFGVGLIVMTERLDKTERPVTVIYMRRTVVLFVFGILHMTLLWFGDILAAYALCAFVVFWFRKQSPRRLLTAGISLFVLCSFLQIWQGWRVTQLAPNEFNEFVKANWVSPPESLRGEIEAFRGSFLMETYVRLLIAHYVQIVDTLLHAGILRPIGMMFVGMALYKKGFFYPEKNESAYWMWMGLALFAGIPITLYGVYFISTNDWSAVSYYLWGRQYCFWAGPIISMGWMSLILLFCKWNWLKGARKVLAAVGQMALSNYILHSLLCTTVFYGHGLGWIGTVTRIQQLGIVVAIWSVQLILSPIWLRYFRYGPLEWLWRSLTYWKFQPLQR